MLKQIAWVLLNICLPLWSLDLGAWHRYAEDAKVTIPQQNAWVLSLYGDSLVGNMSPVRSQLLPAVCLGMKHICPDSPRCPSGTVSGSWLL